MTDVNDLLNRIEGSELSKDSFSFELNGSEYHTHNKFIQAVLENIGKFTEGKKIYSTNEVYTMVGISKNTLIDWEKKYDELIIERDWRGWRAYTEENIQILKKIKNGEIKKK